MYNIFFLHYRAGSTLMQYLLHGRPSGKSKQTFLSTRPKDVCVSTYINCGKLGETCSDFLTAGHLDFLVSTHIGNWWGNLPSKDVPLPYQDPSPMKWSYKEICTLPSYSDTHYRCINLIRDGRNLIESTRRIKSGIEEKFHKQDAMDYFKSLCLGYRNKARIALDCQSQMSNYKIFKFEDILADTTNTLTSIFNFMGYKLNVQVCSRRASDIKARKVGKNHTSFKKNANMNHRWSKWTRYEKEFFKQVAGQELIELGYEQDLSW